MYHSISIGIWKSHTYITLFYNQTIRRCGLDGYALKHFRGGEDAAEEITYNILCDSIEKYFLDRVNSYYTLCNSMWMLYVSCVNEEERSDWSRMEV